MTETQTAVIGGYPVNVVGEYQGMALIDLLTAPLVLVSRKQLERMGYKLGEGQTAVCYSSNGPIFPLYDIRETIQTPGHKAHVKRKMAYQNLAEAYGGRGDDAEGLTEVLQFVQKTSQRYRRPYLDDLRTGQWFAANKNA